MYNYLDNPSSDVNIMLRVATVLESTLGLLNFDELVRIPVNQSPVGKPDMKFNIPDGLIYEDINECLAKLYKNAHRMSKGLDANGKPSEFNEQQIGKAGEVMYKVSKHINVEYIDPSTQSLQARFKSDLKKSAPITVPKKEVTVRQPTFKITKNQIVPSQKDQKEATIGTNRIDLMKFTKTPLTQEEN